MGKTILITGGSGLIGKPLTAALLQKGYHVHHLSRDPQPNGNSGITIFRWNVDKNEIDANCIAEVDAIIHLAGENIAEKRWTSKRKQQIIQSRTASINLIYQLLERSPAHQVKSIISSSAIGYYGNRGNKTLTEDAGPGTGFLPKSCLEWEKAVDKGIDHNLRVVKLRTGIVLTDKGGALPEIAKLTKLGIGSALGSGTQWMSWIHIQDVIKMYLFALENTTVNGTYNMTAPNPVTNSEFTESLGKIFDKKIWLPNVPVIGLKLLMGEMSALVLDSSKTSSGKIVAEGFEFDFPELSIALREIYSE